MTDEDNVSQHGSERELVNAKLRLDEAVAEFSQAQSLGPREQVVASQRLHTAVVRLWWKMRSHLAADGDAWRDLDGYEHADRDHIWQGRHPTTGVMMRIDGLADLREWLDKEVVVSRASESPLNSQTESVQTRPVRLPADAALECAEILAQKFYEFGWSPERDYGLPGEEGFDATQENVERRSKQELNI